MSMLPRIALLAIWLLPTCAALAQTHASIDFDPAIFSRQRDALAAELTADARYKALSETDGERVLDALGQIGELLAGKSSLTELSAEQQIELHNLQSEINQMLSQAAHDSRVVCEREQKVGSRRHVTVCRTLAEWRELRARAARVLVEEKARRDDNLRDALRQEGPQGGG